jgi:hypothetical protein
MNNTEFFKEAGKSFEKEKITKISFSLNDNEMLILGIGFTAVKNYILKDKPITEEQKSLINTIELIQNKIYKSIKEVD